MVPDELFRQSTIEGGQAENVRTAGNLIGFRERLVGFWSDDAFWRFFLYLASLLAFFRGVRTPGLWAATQAQIDYSTGFVKRGLFGALLHMFNIYGYVPFAVLSYVLLAAFIVALWRYFVGRNASPNEFVVAAVYFSSFGFTYLVHIVGYLDILQALLVILTLRIRRLSVRAAAAVAVGILCPLIHEMFLIVFLPLLLLDCVLAATTPAGGKRSTSRFEAGFAGFLTLCTLGVTIAVAYRPSLSDEALSRYSQQLARRVDFHLRLDCMAVLGRSIHDNLPGVFTTGFSASEWRRNQFDGFFEFMPTIVFMLFLGRSLITMEYPRRSQALLVVCIAGASLAPLAMNLIGRDVGRWYALAVLDSFLALGLVRSYAGSSAISDEVMPAWLRNSAVLLMVLSFSSGSALMDGYRVRTFPFTHVVKSLLRDAYRWRIPIPQ